MQEWRQVEIGGKPADILDFSPGQVQFAVIYLHSYNKESLAGNEIFSQLLREGVGAAGADRLKKLPGPVGLGCREADGSLAMRNDAGQSQ